MKKGRKASGGKLKKQRKKKLYESAGIKRIVKLGDKKTKLIRGRGGNRKLVSLSANKVNIIQKGKSKTTTIKNVLETPSNRFLARQNVLVKGAVIETDLGRAKITNRPSQEGCINAVLIEE